MDNSMIYKEDINAPVIREKAEIESDLCEDINGEPVFLLKPEQEYDDNGLDEHDYVNRNPISIVPKSPTTNEDKEMDFCDTHVNRDEVTILKDTNDNQRSYVNVTTKANCLDCFFILVSIATYIGDHSTDVLLARKYYIRSEWLWFALVLSFLVFPSLILQILSFKWHYSDHESVNWFSVILHIIQLGPVDRLFRTFYYGIQTRRTSKNHKKKVKRYELYLQHWRDICMLRFLESFLESCPQVIIQLYIIFQFDVETIKTNWLNLISVATSIVALSWSIVTYTYVLRLCETKNTYKFFGYMFQVLYRIFMVSSRIMAILVFSLEYKWIILIILFIHWLLMTYWLHNVSSRFCLDNHGNIMVCAERLFSCLMGFVYIFCFINVKEGATRIRVTIIYTFFLIENSIFAAAWLTSRVKMGLLEYVTSFMVWGTFLIGIICMMLYYQFFHPSSNVGSGWFHCCDNHIILEESNQSLDEDPRMLSMKGLRSMSITEKVKLQVEFPGRREFGRDEKISNEVFFTIEDLFDELAEEYNRGVGNREIPLHMGIRGGIDSQPQVKVNEFDYSGLQTPFL